jgi:biopolymer transport protein ExbD
MAITVHSADSDDAELNTTINTTPLVDVMLVMLIIFLITVPVVIKNVPVQLPNASNIPTLTKPENIVIAVDKDDNIYWNNQPIDASELKERFADALRANARFQGIGKVILAAQQAGIQKVGFITEPRNDAS